MSIKEQVKAKIELLLEKQKEALNGWYKEFYISMTEKGVATDIRGRIHEAEIRLDTIKEVQKEIYCTLGIWNYDVEGVAKNDK